MRSAATLVTLLVLVLGGCQATRPSAGPEGTADAMIPPRPLFDNLDNLAGLDATATYKVIGDEKEGEPRQVVVTAKFPVLSHPNHATVYGPDNHGIKFYANYVFTIDQPTMRIMSVKIDTNLPPVPAKASLYEPSTFDKYPPRAANTLEYELDLSVMPRDDGRRLEAMMRVRTRILHFEDDTFMSALVDVDQYESEPEKQRSWLRGAPVTGPDGQEIDVLDQRAAEADGWLEATIPVPLEALSWIKEHYDLKGYRESPKVLASIIAAREELSLIIARGTYKPVVKNWAHKVPAGEPKPSSGPMPPIHWIN